MNTPTGLDGLSSPAREVCTRRAIMLQPVILADDALRQRVGEVQHRLRLVADHAADRDAGPVADHGGDRLLVDARQDQRRLALMLGELGLQRAQLVELRVAVGRRGGGVAGRLQVDRHAGLAQLGAQRQDLLDQAALRLPARFEALSASRAPCCERCLDLGRAVADVDADRRLAADDLALGLQRCDAAAACPRPPAAPRAG